MIEDVPFKPNLSIPNYNALKDQEQPTLMIEDVSNLVTLHQEDHVDINNRTGDVTMSEFPATKIRKSENHRCPDPNLVVRPP